MNAIHFCYAVLFLVGLALVISSLETIVSHKKYRQGQLLSWQYQQQFNRVAIHLLFKKQLIYLFDYPGFILLSWIRLAFCIFVSFFILKGWNPVVPMIVLFLTNYLYYLREYLYREGANELINIIIAALLIALGNFEKEHLPHLSLNFIALLSSIAYASSAGLKLQKGWFNGNALLDMLATRSFGNRSIFLFLQKRKWLASIITTLIIVTQGLLAVAFLLPPSVCLPVLICGGLFHLSAAWVMGLNIFLPVYLSTYPAIYFTSCYGILLPTDLIR